MNHEPHNNPLDKLDELVRQAMDVQTDEVRLTRLERYWHEQSKRNRRRRQILFAMPAAAALVLVSITAWSFYVRPNNKPPQEAPSRQLIANRGNESANDLVQESIVTATPLDAETESSGEETLSTQRSPQIAGRQPTAYERLLFVAKRERTTPEDNSRLRISLLQAIEQLASNPELDARELIAATGLRRTAAERRMLRLLPRLTTSQQLAGVKLLTVCGSNRAVPALLRLARSEELREPCFQSILDIGGGVSMHQIVSQCGYPEVRRELCRRLLKVETDSGLEYFLQLCNKPSTRGEALDVLKAMPNPPVERLLEMLDHETNSVRLHACLALGFLNGPAVTQALIDRIVDNPSESDEAWIALIACRGELAEEFKAFASYRPDLLGHFNNARVRWARLIY